MKTEDRWIIPVDFSNLDINGLGMEGIGNSHINSILSTLETKAPINIADSSINLGSLQTVYKHDVDSISQINGEAYSISQSPKNTKKTKKVKNKTQYYIFCNFCPFLCLNNKRINEHLATVHGSNKVTALVPEYRCPACPNIFSHLSSLDSHLLHDHYVTNKCERKIIVQLIEQSKKYSTYVPKVIHKKLENVKQTIVSDAFVDRKEEFDEGIHGNYDVTDDRTATLLLTAELPIAIPNPDDSDVIGTNGPLISLPTIDLSKLHAEQRINHSLLQESVNVDNTPIKVINHSLLQETIQLRDENNPVKVILDGSFSENNSKKAYLNLDDDEDDCILPEQDSDGDKLEKINNRTNLDASTMGDQLYRCLKSLCHVRMRCSSKLHYHQKCHSASTESAFTCPECSMAFSQWKPLTGHLWRSHRVDMELYCCDQCDYRTFSLSKLNNTHKLIHGDARNYACAECNRAFKNIKQLRNHKALHKRSANSSDLSAFTCDVCAKIFGEKRKLKLHKDTVHMKLKPFLCSYCGYKGATRTALKVHSRQHTGEKPFQCSECNFISADHNSLRRHKLRHSGKRPYQCAHCDYSCIQSNTYKVHLKTKHPGLEKDLLFACAQCSFRSVNKDIYLSHLRTVHEVLNK